MGYLKHHLLEQEVLQFQTKKHWIIFFPVLIWLIITGYVAHTAVIFPKIALIPLLITLITAITSAIDYFFSEYAVTNVRLILKEGLIWRRSTTEKLSAIAKTEVDQSILGRIFGYGHLIVFSFGGANRYSMLCRPIEFQKQLQRYLN